MSGAQQTEAVREFERGVIANIPIAAAMDIRVAECDPARLVLAAPFAPNRNHAGIAFGGAIECLGTLACWGLLWFALEAPDARIVIRRAETDFRAPLTGELRAEARAPDADTWAHFTRQFMRHGRARIELVAIVGDAKQTEGARFRGSFVAARNAATSG